MKMLQLLGLSSLIALAFGACVLPPAPTSAPYATTPLVQVNTNDGRIMYYCATGYIVGNYGAGGALVADFSDDYKCDPAVGKLISNNGQESALATMTCAPAFPVDEPGLCGFTTNGVIYVLRNQQKDVKCPTGQVFQEATLGEILSLQCVSTVTHATLPNGAVVSAQPGGNLPEVKCVAPKPTTTTAATTTTKKPDAPVNNAQLWTVYTYYNYGLGVHAFCADQVCVSAIQSNGIGYDPVNGKVVMGRAISESMINSVRASCPTGSANLRNLAFNRYGNHYEHNLSGSGLKQGWVAITNGACGANLPIKKWKSRYTDDMMYGEDLEWNTWYSGMAQDGGRVQYYMWN